MSLVAKANRILLPSFALLVYPAYRTRRDPERHKRYVLVATLCMLEPVISRAFDRLSFVLRNDPASVVDGAWSVCCVVLWTGLFSHCLRTVDSCVGGSIAFRLLALRGCGACVSWPRCCKATAARSRGNIRQRHSQARRRMTPCTPCGSHSVSRSLTHSEDTRADLRAVCLIVFHSHGAASGRAP